jgi:hypothetical protein
VTELEQLALDPLVPQPWFSPASRPISAAISALIGGLPAPEKDQVEQTEGHG